MDKDNWKEALLLVENLPDDEPRVVPETVNELCRIRDPIRCVAFVGPYRSGKSNMANVLLSILYQKEDVFPVGNTVESKTKGLWIWCGRHPQESDSWIVFMDTEGLSDVQKGDNLNDLQNFLLSLLLSSVFVYNSRGTIDYQAIEKLHYVSSIADQIRLRKETTKDDEDDDEEEIGYDLLFPAFVWVVRDFHLEKSVDGVEKTDDEYLANALHTRKDGSKPSQLSVKRCIKEYFPSRKCFTFPPLVTKDASGRKETTDARRLLQGLADYIIRSPLKVYEGTKITGQVLGRLTEAYIAALPGFEKESKPRLCVQQIVTGVKDQENIKVLHTCLETYRKSMTKKCAGIYEEVELYQLHIDCSDAAVKTYMESAVKPIQSHYPLLTDMMKMEFSKLCEAKKREAKEIFEQHWNKMKADTVGDAEQYMVVGGYQKFTDNITELKRRCGADETLKGTSGCCYVLQKLSELDEKEGKLIMLADKRMTELKQKEEQMRLKTEREQEESRIARKATTVTKDLKSKVKDFEAATTFRLKKDVEEQMTTEKTILQQRIRALEKEKEELKRNGLKEEEENRRDRMEKYSQMVVEKQQEEQSIWSMIGNATGEFLSNACNAVVSNVDSPLVRSVVSVLGSIGQSLELW